MRVGTIISTVALAVLTSSVAPADAVSPDTLVTFASDLPGRYQLLRVDFVVDGALRTESTTPYAIAHVPPGRHVVEVIAHYRIHDPVFTYLDHYGIEVRSAHLVRPAQVGRREVDARAIYVGGATTPLERRTAIAWQDR